MKNLDFTVLEEINISLNKQIWHHSTLYIVATPIGNLSDLSMRAWYILNNVHLIAAEDTRVTKLLLSFFKINTQIICLNEHNEDHIADIILKRIQLGQSVALVTDSGTPTISDPGSKLIRLIRSFEYRVSPIPGPSSVMAAVMSSGLIDDRGFIFAGFVPKNDKNKIGWLKKWCDNLVPIVMFETALRLKNTVTTLVKLFGENKKILLARELTKYFEEISYLTLSKTIDFLSNNSIRGEIVMIFDAQDKTTKKSHLSNIVQCVDEIDIMRFLMNKISTKEKISFLSKLLGLSKKELYKNYLLYKKNHNTRLN